MAESIYTAAVLGVGIISAAPDQHHGSRPIKEANQHTIEQVEGNHAIEEVQPESARQPKLIW